MYLKDDTVNAKVSLQGHLEILQLNCKHSNAHQDIVDV